MITREKLEEMIENGETVYAVFIDQPFGIDLTKNYTVVSVNDYDWLCIEDTLVYMLSDLFSTKDQAEWTKKFATREERFEPPHWSEIDLGSMDRAAWWTYSFSVPKLHCRGQILIHNSIYVDWGYTGYCVDQKSFGLATKENYEKAVDFARKLFLGEVEK